MSTLESSFPIECLDHEWDHCSVWNWLYDVYTGSPNAHNHTFLMSWLNAADIVSQENDSGARYRVWLEAEKARYLLWRCANESPRPEL